MFQALQKFLPALRTGAVNRSVGDGVLQWSAAEQMPLGYDVPSARQRRAGNGLPRQCEHWLTMTERVGTDDSVRPLRAALRQARYTTCPVRPHSTPR